MTVIVLALLGLMVLVVTFAPQQNRVQSGAQPTPVASAPPANLTDPDAFDVTRTLSAAPDAEAQTVEAELGDRVEIVVEGEQPDLVQLGEVLSQVAGGRVAGPLGALGGNARCLPAGPRQREPADRHLGNPMKVGA